RGGAFGVVVADMRMPGMNGVEFLKQVKTRYPDTVRLMLTGDLDQATAIEALTHGSIFRFMTKPCRPKTLFATLDASVRQYHLITAERELLEETLGGCIRLLTDVMSMTDARLHTRCSTLREMTHNVTRAMRLRNAWEIDAAAMLARIGSIAIPPAVLVRARIGRTLTGAEKDMLDRIPDIGH